MRKTSFSIYHTEHQHTCNTLENRPTSILPTTTSAGPSAETVAHGFTTAETPPCCRRRPTHRPALRVHYLSPATAITIVSPATCLSSISICNGASLSDCCCPARQLSCRASNVSEDFPSRQASKHTLGKAPPILHRQIPMPLVRMEDDMGSSDTALRHPVRAGLAFHHKVISPLSVVSFRWQP